VRHASPAFAKAVFLATTLRGVNRLIDGNNNVSHRDVAGFSAKGIPAAWTPGGFDQFMAAQFAEKLLKVRQRNLLALADGSQGDRAVVLAQPELFLQPPRSVNRLTWLCTGAFIVLNCS